MNKWRVLSTMLLFATATFCHLVAAEIMPVPKGKQQSRHTPLHEAVSRGEVELEALQKILESGVDINAKTTNGCTALHYAWPQTAERLLSLGADVNAKDNTGNTPLHHAKPEKGRILVAYGAEVNVCNDTGKTPLHGASHQFVADTDYVRFLIDRGADIHAKDDHGLTPLWVALDVDIMLKANEEVVRLLIEEGSDVNARAKSPDPNLLIPVGRRGPGDFRQRAPLHLVIRDLPHLFPLCVDHGADLNLLDRYGETLMHYAAGSDLAVLDFLVDHCGNIHARNHLDYTPLHNAARAGKLDIVRRLVALGADIHAKTRSLETPVFHAIWEHGVQWETAKFLHQCGAELTGVNHKGTTLLHNAVASYNGELAVELLLEHGLDINARDNAGNTPLHVTAECRSYTKMYDLLVRHGADVNAKNAEGRTPLHIAVKTAHNSSDERIACLIGHGAELEAVDEHGRTPLFYTIWRYDGVKIAQPLLEAGANMSARDSEGKTLVHYAAMRGDLHGTSEWIDHFVVAGLDLNAKDNAGNTPLHDAAKYPYMVKKLLEAGADKLPKMPPP